MGLFDYGDFSTIDNWADQPSVDTSSYQTPIDSGSGITYGVDGTPTGWYDPSGLWSSYGDVAQANGGLEGLNQYLTGGQDYSYSQPLDIWGTLQQYGPAIAGGVGVLGNLYSYYQQKQLIDAQRELEEMRAKQIKAEIKQNQNQMVLDRAGDVDKMKLIMGKMQEKGLLPQGYDPNELLGRAYSNNQSVFGSKPFNLNTFASNPFQPVPQFSPLAAASSSNVGASPMAQILQGGNFARGGLNVLSPEVLPPAQAPHMRGLMPMMAGGGQTDNININTSGGEYVIPADTVADLGDGNTEQGGRALDALVKNVRHHKGKKNALPPQAKSALDYLRG